MSATVASILGKGSALMSQERWAEAIDLFLSQPELLDFSWELAWNAGWAHFKIRQYAKAIELLRRSTLLAPEKATTWWALGTIQGEAGDLPAAESNLRRSLALKEKALTRQSLALVLMKQKRWSEAEGIHRDGLERCPDSALGWQSYGTFLSDMGRRDEALTAYKRYRALRKSRRDEATV